MNNAQRRYLKERLDEVVTNKLTEVNKTYLKTKNAFPQRGDKLAYVRELLKDVPGIVKVEDAYGLVTDKEVAWEEEYTVANEVAKVKRQEIAALKNSVMDNIMLGDDAALVGQALATIENFKV